MICAVRNNRSYYHEALKQAKKDDQEKLRSAEIQKRACEQFKDLREKKTTIAWKCNARNRSYWWRNF